MTVNGHNYPLHLIDFLSRFCNTSCQFPRENNITNVFVANLINDCYPLPGISDHEIVFVNSMTNSKKIITMI